MHGELAELFLWKKDDGIRAALQDLDFRQRLGGEMADVLVFLLYLAEASGIDLGAAVECKMVVNAGKYPLEKARDLDLLGYGEGSPETIIRKYQAVSAVFSPAGTIHIAECELSNCIEKGGGRRQLLTNSRGPGKFEKQKSYGSVDSLMQETTSPPSAEDLHKLLDSLRGLAKALVGKAEAEDLLSSTYIKALERPPKSSRNTRAWMARVMRNLAVDQGRSSRSRRNREDRVSQPQGKWGPDEIAVGREAKSILLQTLQELDRSKQDVLTLRYLDGLTPNEIATKLDLSVVATRVRITRALKAMRRALGAKYGKDWMSYCYVLAVPQISGTGSSTVESDLVGKTTLTCRSGFIGLFGAIMVGLTAMFLPFIGEDSALVYEGEASTAPLDSSELETKGNAHPAERTPILEDLGFETVFVMDYQGEPVSDASISILGDEYLWKGREVTATPGLFKVGPKGGLVEKDRELMLLITSLGHAPYYELFDARVSHRVIHLPRKSVVSGQADLSTANKSMKHFLLLGLEKMQPEEGTLAFKFRKNLNSEQRYEFDDAFHSAYTTINQDGYFEVDGMDEDWDGPLIYQNQINSMVGSMPWNENQVFWVHGPRSDIYLTFVERPYIVGEILGAEQFERIQLGSISSLDGTVLTSQIHKDEESQTWRVYADSLPEEKLTAQLFVVTGTMDIPVNWRDEERTEFSVQVGAGDRRKWRFIDGQGKPISGVKIRPWRGEVIARSNEDGIANLVTYGKYFDLQVDDPKWLKINLRSGPLEQVCTMLPKVGVSFELPTTVHVSGFSLIADLGMAIRLRCSQGLADFNQEEGGQFFADQNWYQITFDPATGLPIEAYVPINSAEPSFVGNLGIQGDVECTLLEDGEAIWHRVIPKSAWDESRRIQFDIHPREERVLDFQAVGPDRQPMRYALVKEAVPSSVRGHWGNLDGYGMGNSDAFDPEMPLVIHQPGYHPSPIFRMKDLCLEQRREIYLSPARIVKGDLADFETFCSAQDLLLEAIRPSDQHVFERHTGGGSLKFVCCPLAPFQVRASTEWWIFEFWCAMSQDSLTVDLPGAVDLSISVADDRSFSLNDIASVSLHGSQGIWTIRNFLLNQNDEGGMTASIPGFTNISLVTVQLLNGEKFDVASAITESGESWKLEL
ncbi:MAG: sigma-70 family RNA polymerase sigma factor [Planctomycetes bacterium]|nr:sigma-70 family RNA polymerase sigma factor [Planctomycetota bacterium]